ncbi:MAG: D-amino acid dehydrogenase [Pseudomonadota bacterium]
MTHIAVIGAGVTGVTTAYELALRGLDVTIYDRHRYAAMETSFANGGQLSVSNAEVWTQWGTVLKGLSWMLRRDAPLLVNPTPEWRKIAWMARFMTNIPNYRKHTVETVRLALSARRALFETAAREGIDFDHAKRGILHFYGKEATLAHARRVTEMLAEGGLERREVSPSEISAIEPALTGEFVGGFFTESDSTGDIHKFTVGLAAACELRGVEMRLGEAVTGLARTADGVRVETERDANDHDGVVICAGVRSTDFAAQLGERLPIYPVKGYSITVHLNDRKSRENAPEVSLLDDDAKIVTSRLGPDRFRVAGTAEFNGYNQDIRADRVRPLTRWVERHFPGVSTEHVTPWAGLRPMTPSMLPRVGAGGAPGVFYNTGHGHLG